MPLGQDEKTKSKLKIVFQIEKKNEHINVCLCKARSGKNAVAHLGVLGIKNEKVLLDTRQQNKNMFC